MGSVKNRVRDRFIHSSTMLLVSTGVIFIVLLSIPRGDSLWSRQLKIEGQVNAGIWATPTGTETATPTITETPTPTTTPTETPPSGAGTSLEVTVLAKGFKAGEVDPVYGVEGQVCVLNVGDFQTQDLKIQNIIEVKTKGGPFENIMDFEVDISGQPIIESYRAYCFPYFKIFNPSSDSETKYRLTSEVTISNHSGWMPGGTNCPGPQVCPFGPSEKEDFDFIGELSGQRAEITFTYTLTPTLTSTPTETMTTTPSRTSTLDPNETPLPTYTPSSTSTDTPRDEIASPTSSSTSEPSLTDTPEPSPTDTPEPPLTITPESEEPPQEPPP